MKIEGYNLNLLFDSDYHLLAFKDAYNDKNVINIDKFVILSLKSKMLLNLYGMYPKTKPYSIPTLVLSTRIRIVGKLYPFNIFPFFYLISRLSYFGLCTSFIISLTLDQWQHSFCAEIIIPKNIIFLVFTHMTTHLVEYSLILTLILISLFLWTYFLISKDKTLDA